MQDRLALKFERLKEGAGIEQPRGWSRTSRLKAHILMLAGEIKRGKMLAPRGCFAPLEEIGGVEVEMAGEFLGRYHPLIRLHQSRVIEHSRCLRASNRRGGQQRSAKQESIQVDWGKGGWGFRKMEIQSGAAEFGVPWIYLNTNAAFCSSN